MAKEKKIWVPASIHTYKAKGKKTATRGSQAIWAPRPSQALAGMAESALCPCGHSCNHTILMDSISWAPLDSVSQVPQRWHDIWPWKVKGPTPMEAGGQVLWNDMRPAPCFYNVKKSGALSPLGSTPAPPTPPQLSLEGTQDPGSLIPVPSRASGFAPRTSKFLSEK